jgi:hypothetical protein
MRHIHFFALKEDLLPVIDSVESKVPVKYALTGNFLKRQIPNGIFVVHTGGAIPDLGRATANQSIACSTYLVTEREAPIDLRHLQAIDGERICVDQLVNPDSVTFTPAGIWNEDVVIHGRVATVSDTPIAQALMKRFYNPIRKTFTKLRAFYVGPNALTLLKSGKRFTGALQSPPEFDLTLT